MKYIITENKLDKVVITWLNDKFGNLTEVVRDDKTFYVNEDRLFLFYYFQDYKNGYVYISYDEIWSFLESIFGLESLQIKGIITHWLEETYNLKGLKPAKSWWDHRVRLEETYNLKKEMKYIITENRINQIIMKWFNDKFGDLKPIVRNGKTFYINEDRLVLFYYYHDDKNRDVYINNDEIWSFLKSIFGLESKQIEDIIKQWLGETYNLNDLTPRVNVYGKRTWVLTDL
jgi:hypothetical protein